MSLKRKSIIWFLFFFLVGLLSVYLTYRKYPAQELLKSLASADFRWYIPVLLASILCHLIRAARWQLLVTASGEKIRFSSSIIAVMAGYFINFLTPRFGELLRCIVVRSTDQIPLEKGLATVFLERMVDVLSLLLIFLMTLFFYYDRMGDFYLTHIQGPLWQWLQSGNNPLIFLFVFLLLLVGGGWIMIGFRKNKHRLGVRLLQGWENFKLGIWSIRNLRRKWLFLLYTFLIWWMYLLMTYFWFFGIKETAHLDWKAALFVITFGGIARALPVQAYGMGLYQQAVMQVLLILQVPEKAGLSLGTIIYSGQTLFYLVLGGLAFLYYLLFARKSFRQKI